VDITTVRFDKPEDLVPSLRRGGNDVALVDVAVRGAGVIGALCQGAEAIGAVRRLGYKR
jgi:hypothetical protein